MDRHRRNRLSAGAAGPCGKARGAVRCGLHDIIFKHKGLGLNPDQTFRFIHYASSAGAVRGQVRHLRHTCVDCASHAVQGISGGWSRSHQQEDRWRFCMGNATSSRVPACSQIAASSNVPKAQ
jgi:hypothetical protein